MQELTGALGSSQQNVSKHLGVLHLAGILSRRKDGNHVRYAIADDSVFALCALVCGGLERQATSSPACSPSGREPRPPPTPERNSRMSSAAGPSSGRCSRSPAPSSSSPSCLAVTVSPWFLAMTAFTGVSLWLYVLVRSVPRLARRRAGARAQEVRVVTGELGPIGRLGAWTADPLPDRRRRLDRDRGRARHLRAPRRARPLRRRLGGERLRVGAGPRADPGRASRGSRAPALMVVVHSDERDGRRSGLPGDDRPTSRRSSARATPSRRSSCPPSGYVDLRGRAHGDRPGRRGRDPNGMVDAADDARRASSRRRPPRHRGQPHRRLRHVGRTSTRPTGAR